MRISLDKPIALWSYGVSEGKRTKTNMTTVISKGRSRILKWGVNFCNNVREIKYCFNISGIRKKKRQRGAEKGGWKFTHFTSDNGIYNMQHSQQIWAQWFKFKSCGTKQIKGGINLYIELQEHKLDQIVQGKHKNFARQAYSFLEVMLRSRLLRRKT